MVAKEHLTVHVDRGLVNMSINRKKFYTVIISGNESLQFSDAFLFRSRGGFRKLFRGKGAKTFNILISRFCPSSVIEVLIY